METVTDSYLDLVRAFPLVHIADDSMLDQAQQVLDGLLVQDLDDGGTAYLNALTDLIEHYETNNLSFPEASPHEVLTELMTANRLSQQDLAQAVGITQSTISGVLTGKRKLTTGHIARLAKHFHVPQSVFLAEEIR